MSFVWGKAAQAEERTVGAWPSRASDEGSQDSGLAWLQVDGMRDEVWASMSMIVVDGWI